MYSHCTTGGWILGNKIDGTQAEFVRVPHADTSLYPVPADADEEALVMLSDILPTGFECGVLNGKVTPGSSVAIVGAGPIGLAALLTAQFYAPSALIVIDLDDNRLEVAKRFGVTATINSADGQALQRVMELTANLGVDTAIEAVGVPATFELCEAIVAPGGVIAQDRSQVADHPSLQVRQDPRRLRDLRSCSQDRRSQGDHRNLVAETGNGPALPGVIEIPAGPQGRASGGE